MRAEALFAGLGLAIAVCLLIAFTNDTISLLFIAIMGVLVLLGFLFGFISSMRYAKGFQYGAENIRRALNVQAKDCWTTLYDQERVFLIDDMDAVFHNYQEIVQREKEKGSVIFTDIAEFFNEDMVELHTWKRPVSLIPDALTGLGILGTFVGLISGITNTMFTSAESAISSIHVLLGGMDTAFYTTIAGVILSLLFNFLYEILWTLMLRDMNMFLEVFHHFVIGSREVQEHQLQTEQTVLLRSIQKQLCAEAGEQQ